MMPAAEGMTHMIPNHVLRVGQTTRLDPTPETIGGHDDCGDRDLEISLENLNRIILELDPTFEPLHLGKSGPSASPTPDDCCSDEDLHSTLVPRGCPTPSAMPSTSPSIPIPPRGGLICSPDDCCSDEDLHSTLVPRGCPTPSAMPSTSPSIPIPPRGGLICSPPGTLVFSSSPCSSLPPLPCGSAPRRILSSKSEAALSPGSLRLSPSNRNSVCSLLSMSTCSDTSYILGSNLSLASEEADSSESILVRTCGSFSDGSSRTRPCERPWMTKHCHPQDIPFKGDRRSPASLSGSSSDIPVLLINGAPQPDPGIHETMLEMDWTETISGSRSKPCPPQSFPNRLNNTQPTMKFVMDTSQFWFRPHTTRAEAEALVKDKEAGTFVVRDSTSYRGSFGLAMKVDPGSPEQNSSELVRHFLIESSAKGVRVKGSSQEPYFGSLSALVYQHTISAYALPCKLLLHSKDASAAEWKANDKPTSEDMSKRACNFVYLNAVPTEMLTGPCAVQKAVSSTLEAPASFRATIVNLKVSLKGVTLTDINRKLFFRRHYPAHLLSHSGKDPENRLWGKGSCVGARMFGFVAKGVEAGMENVCHVFAEYDPLQPCNKVIEAVQAAIGKTQTQKD